MALSLVGAALWLTTAVAAAQSVSLPSAPTNLGASAVGQSAKPATQVVKETSATAASASRAAAQTAQRATPVVQHAVKQAPAGVAERASAVVAETARRAPVPVTLPVSPAVSQLPPSLPIEPVQVPDPPAVDPVLPPVAQELVAQAESVASDAVSDLEATVEPVTGGLVDAHGVVSDLDSAVEPVTGGLVDARGTEDALGTAVNRSRLLGAVTSAVIAVSSVALSQIDDDPSAATHPGTIEPEAPKLEPKAITLDMVLHEHGVAPAAAPRTPTAVEAEGVTLEADGLAGAELVTSDVDRLAGADVVTSDVDGLARVEDIMQPAAAANDLPGPRPSVLALPSAAQDSSPFIPSPPMSAAPGGSALSSAASTGSIPATVSLTLIALWHAVWQVARRVPSVIVLPNLAPPG